MIIPVTTDYTLTASQFTDTLNLKPDVILLCSVDKKNIYLPAIADLPNGYGQVQVQTESVEVIVNCAIGSVDLFTGGSDSHGVKENSIVIFESAPNNTWFALTSK